MPTALIRMTGLAVLLVAGLLLLVYLLQSRLIYFPSRVPETNLVRAAAQQGLEPWRDGTGAIIGWRGSRSGEIPKYRLLVFHGNAGTAVDRAYFKDGLQPLEAGAIWDVHLFEYPGYGARPGNPGEKSFAEAAGKALAELTAADERPVFLLGESLGSGVACGLAGRFPERVAGLILATPMTSLVDVAAVHYPVLPVRWLLRDRYDSVEALRGARCPAAFVLAGKDEIVPSRLGRALHDGYSGAKRLWIQAEATHNTLDYRPGAAWWAEVTEFLRASSEER